MNHCPECQVVFGPICPKHPRLPDKDGWVTLTKDNYKEIFAQLQKLIDARTNS